MPFQRSFETCKLNDVDDDDNNNKRRYSLRMQNVAVVVAVAAAIAIIITLIMINNNNNLFTISPFANVFLLALLMPTKFVNKLSIRNGMAEGESMQHLANIDSHCVC